MMIILVLILIVNLLKEKRITMFLINLLKNYMIKMIIKY